MIYLSFKPMKAKKFRLYFFHHNIIKYCDSPLIDDVPNELEYVGYSKDGSDFKNVSNVPVLINPDKLFEYTNTHYYVDLTDEEMNADTIMITLGSQAGWEKWAETIIIYTK